MTGRSEQEYLNVRDSLQKSISDLVERVENMTPAEKAGLPGNRVLQEYEILETQGVINELTYYHGGND